MIGKWLLLLTAALVTAGVILLVLRRHRQQLVILRRLRASGMYSGVHRMLQEHDPNRIERITITPDGIELMELPNITERYSFREHSIDPLSKQNLQAMMQAIALDLPDLQSHHYYTFTRSSRSSAVPGYTFTMKHARKDYLMRTMNGL